jgi:predicted naringenin-chalcone synthase
MILGIGTAQPTLSISQSDSCTMAKSYSCKNVKQAHVLEQLYRRTDIKRRSIVLINERSGQIDPDFFTMPSHNFESGPSTALRMERYNEAVKPLAQRACQSALLNANVSSREITHLVTSSCTGFAAPGFDLNLVDALPLNRDVARTHVGFMGCNAALNALRVANSFSVADENAVVLVCAAEICSVHFQYGWDSDAIIANSLFADGAAAVVLKGGARSPSYFASHSFIVPDTHGAMTWNIGDNGFVMRLDRNIPDVIEAHLSEVLSSWLAKMDLSLTDISSWAVHPGGPRILSAVENALALSASALSCSRQILESCGNMSSPTVLFILQRLLEANDSLPCVLLAFGPGLTIEAALIV